jgi:cytoskeleton protein RodZ
MAERQDTAEFAGEADSIDTQAAKVQPKASALCASRRAELGMSIEDVANQLKFAPRQIEALEAGEFGRLPGGTFARGMARSYSKLLKLDPEPLLAELVASGVGPQPGPEEAVSLRTPIPFSEGGKHVNLVYTGLSVVLLAVVIYFAFEWYQEKSGPAKMAFVGPGTEQTSAGAVPLSPVAVAPPVSAAAKSTEPKAETFASMGLAPVPETVARSDEPRPPVAAGKGRLVLRFEKDAWVEIKSRTGQTLLAQLNPAGSEKVIDGDPPFQLTIGNAPSVQLFYNDQPVDLKPHFKVDVARLTLK